MATTTSTRSTSTTRTRRAPARAPRRTRASAASSLFLSEMPAVAERPPRRTRVVATPVTPDVLSRQPAHVDVCINCAHLPMSANTLIAILTVFTVAVSSILLASSVIIGAQATRIEALQGVPPQGPVAQR